MEKQENTESEAKMKCPKCTAHFLNKEGLCLTCDYEDIEDEEDENEDKGEFYQKSH